MDDFIRTRHDHLKKLIDEGLLPETDLKVRMSGRSTAIALETISQAMLNPETWISVYDHHPTHEMSRHQLNSVQRLVNKLELHGFSFSRSRIAMKYSLTPLP